MDDIIIFININVINNIDNGVVNNKNVSDIVGYFIISPSPITVWIKPLRSILFRKFYIGNFFDERYPIKPSIWISPIDTRVNKGRTSPEK